MNELKQYSDWLKDVKSRIQQSQIKAAVKINQELLRLYWLLGKDIVEMQKSSHWEILFCKTSVMICPMNFLI